MINLALDCTTTTWRSCRGNRIIVLITHLRTGWPMNCWPGHPRSASTQPWVAQPQGEPKLKQSPCQRATCQTLTPPFSLVIHNINIYLHSLLFHILPKYMGGIPLTQCCRHEGKVVGGPHEVKLAWHLGTSWWLVRPYETSSCFSLDSHKEALGGSTQSYLQGHTPIPIGILAHLTTGTTPCFSRSHALHMVDNDT